MNFLARVAYIYIVRCPAHITLGGQEMPARFATNWYNMQSPAASPKDIATFPYILQMSSIYKRNSTAHRSKPIYTSPGPSHNLSGFT